MLDPRAIRDLSLARARELGCAPTGETPLLPDVGLAPRTREEALARLLCLHVSAACAYGFDRASAARWVEQEGLDEHLTERERAFVERGDGDSFLFQVRIEAMWALAWGLGLVEELAFDEPCADEFVLQMPDLRELQSADGLRAAARVRSQEELVDHLDLATCLHGAALAAELGGPQLPEGMGLHNVAQRRHALAWLLGDEAWDRIALAT